MWEISDRLSTALAGRYKLERHLEEGGTDGPYLKEHCVDEGKLGIKTGEGY